MTQVDFYVLSRPGVNARLAFACRLAEKAYKLQHQVHIHAADTATAADLDDLLWTFRDGSFVPHDRLGSSELTGAAVTIGWGDAKPGSCELLINVADETPEFADSFARIAELVSSDDDSKSHGRKRFAAYRENGCELESHKIGQA